MAKFHCWDIGEQDSTTKDDGSEIEAGDAEEAAEKHAANLDDYDPASSPEEKRIIKVLNVSTNRETLVRVKSELVVKYCSEIIDE